MATNMLYKDGKHLKLAIASISSGDPVAVEQITGVALIDTDANGDVVIDTKGVYDLSVKGESVMGDAAVKIGEKLYYSSGSTPKLTNLPVEGLPHFGYALEEIAYGVTDTIMVLLK